MSRSRTQTLVLAGLALTVLLAVVAFVARGHSAPGGSGGQNRGASQTLANAVFTIWFLGMALGAVLMVVMLATGRRQQSKRKRRNRWAAFGTMLVILALLTSAFGIHKLRGFQHGHGQRAHPNAFSNPGAGLKRVAKQREHSHKIADPSFEWPLAAGLVALVLGAVLTALLRAKARRSKLLSEVVLIQEMRQMLDETLDDLRAEADPRKAVIAAYARMERILGMHGLPRRPSEAPQEYLERVLAELRVTKPAVERLTELFSRAKFSQHDVDPRMKDDAIEALVTLREQIRAIGSTIDKPALALSEVPAQ
jgi:hypothetical protein